MEATNIIPLPDIRRIERLLRCCKTKTYYAGQGLWTDEAEQAQKFDSELDAARIVVERELKEVDLVLRVAGAEHDLFATRMR